MKNTESTLNSQQKEKRGELLGEMVRKRVAKGMTVDEAVEDVIFGLAASGGCDQINNCSIKIINNEV